MKKALLIFSSQEYETANHQELWLQIASKFQGEVVIVNIPADYIVSVLKGKTYRIREANRPPIRLSANLHLIRPLVPIRPEIIPKSFQQFLASYIWKCVNTVIPDIYNRDVTVLTYYGYWVRVLKGSHRNLHFAYYIFDEFRYGENENNINKKAWAEDEFACRNSDIVFTMTSKIAKAREAHCERVIVLGNGATKKGKNLSKIYFKRSVAFIGNFRDWIDRDLLERLIKKRNDVTFGFVGPVEDNMTLFLRKLLNENINTFYFGKVKKEEIENIYGMFDVVIVPYKQTDFMKATRPIKIVESVFAGTPVVTIPMDGYQQSSFIRFARNVDEFSAEIDYLINNPINVNSIEYVDFIKNNSWSSKAEMIINEIN